jgi:hypothetical protein
VTGIEGARRALSDWLDWLGFIDAARNRDWIATLAAMRRVRPGTTRWIGMRPCRKKRAMWRVQWRTPSSHCVPGGFRQYRQLYRDHGQSEWPLKKRRTAFYPACSIRMIFPVFVRYRTVFTQYAD